MNVYALNTNTMSLEIYEFWFLLIFCHELYRKCGLVGNANIVIYSVKNYTR